MAESIPGPPPIGGITGSTPPPDAYDDDLTIWSRLARIEAMLRSTAVTFTSWKRTCVASTVCWTGFGADARSMPESIADCVCDAFEPGTPYRDGWFSRSARSWSV